MAKHGDCIVHDNSDADRVYTALPQRPLKAPKGHQLCQPQPHQLLLSASRLHPEPPSPTMSMNLQEAGQQGSKASAGQQWLDQLTKGRRNVNRA